MPEQRLLPGAVAWASLDPARGREQAGRRPVLVVSSSQHLEVVTTLALVVPVTSVDRSWPNHVPLSGNHGLSTASYALTEQLRTISRDRLGASLGLVDDVCLREVRAWLADFLDLQVS